MTTINLYQNQEGEEKRISQRANGGFIFSLSILIVTLLALVGVKLWSAMLAKNNAALEDTIKNQSNGLAEVNSLQKVLDTQTRVNSIKSVLQIKNNAVGKTKMTDVLDHLGAEMSSGAVVTSYTFEQGKIKVKVSANNFSDAARQLLNFKKSSYFANANLISIERGETSINSEIEMTLK